LFYEFIFTTCTSIENVDLLCKYFINFLIFINFIITLFEDGLTMFSKLVHFLDSRVVYRKKKGTLLVGSKLKTHTTEFLEAQIKKNQTIVNMTMLQR